MNENSYSVSQMKQVQNERCAICSEVITKEDLIHVSGGMKVHFRCYIEIQEKICSICGRPFIDQEELYFCTEHKEYFHTTHNCLWNHLQKHMPFRKGKYDAKKNRIMISEKE
ncbi:MAG: hypothetical protein ACFFDW_04890 [Candidatus Thorarchaeota archaeon]